MGESLTNAGGVALLGLLVNVAPLATAIAYLLRPSEHRLALMRPFSLAALFAGLGTLAAGLANDFQMISRSGAIDPPLLHRAFAGAAESLVPLFVTFATLTVSWLCAAAGLRK